MNLEQYNPFSIVVQRTTSELPDHTMHGIHYAHESANIDANLLLFITLRALARTR